ncbi:unnamed protein product [Chondrus crispus]|uniref:Uncharacterized protein n=1 Tax=Chondrus crispus TaxID=2769 RepID=R7QRN0_CHOCR|nr:unnamed protein product [Chondrus crispus]CDF40403.1 unnamed protein product [Chondrus crispus]|eukprot:XP_005710697.1 unnamed protein product [Chondrus crispus]
MLDQLIVRHAAQHPEAGAARLQRPLSSLTPIHIGFSIERCEVVAAEQRQNT